MNRIIKKSLRIFLRILGVWALLGILAATSSFLYEIQKELYGVTSFVGAHYIIYVGELWDFFYTNPKAMIGRSLLNTIAITMIVFLLSALTVWGMQKKALFPKIGKFDKFLIAALFFSLIICGLGKWTFSATEKYCSKQYDMVKACQTLADHKKLLGPPLFDEIVQETDSEWLKTLGGFECAESLPTGFVPGRRLLIFGIKHPRVYVLLWLENDKMLQRNGCYQAVRLPQRQGTTNVHQ